MTVHSSPRPTRPGLPVGSVQERQAGLPEPLRALHRRLRAGFLTHGGPPERAAVADIAVKLGPDRDQALEALANFHTDPLHAQTYLQAHPGMTGELLGQANAVETAERVFGGLLEPQPRRTIDDELAG